MQRPYFSVYREVLHIVVLRSEYDMVQLRVPGVLRYEQKVEDLKNVA